jgi:hypothetical protein
MLADNPFSDVETTRQLTDAGGFAEKPSFVVVQARTQDYLLQTH